MKIFAYKVAETKANQKDVRPPRSTVYDEEIFEHYPSFIFNLQNFLRHQDKS